MGFSSNTDGRHSPYDKNVKLLSQGRASGGMREQERTVMSYSSKGGSR